MFIYGSVVLKSGAWRGGGREAMRNVFFMVPECVEKGGWRHNGEYLMRFARICLQTEQFIWREEVF
jgi:hypothetical protein